MQLEHTQLCAIKNRYVSVNKKYSFMVNWFYMQNTLLCPNVWVLVYSPYFAFLQVCHLSFLLALNPFFIRMIHFWSCFNGLELEQSRGLLSWHGFETSSSRKRFQIKPLDISKCKTFLSIKIVVELKGTVQKSGQVWSFTTFFCADFPKEDFMTKLW